MSAPLITSAIRSILQSAPGIFAPVAQHPATEKALAGAYRELRAVPDHSLDSVAACSARADDVVRIHRLARERLSDGWYDEEDLLAMASTLIADGQIEHPDTVIIHLISRFTAGEGRLIKALDKAGNSVVNVGVTGDPDSDDATATAYALADLSVPSTVAVETPRASEILSASDPDDEVRAVIRTVTRWMDEGIRFGRIAILYPTADPYARLLQEQFEAAGIAINGTPVRSIGEMLYGRTIRNLLSLSDNDFRRKEVLSLISDAPIRGEDGRVPSRAWERVSRAAGIVRGNDWDGRLLHWAEAQQQRAEADTTDGLEWRAAHCRNDARRAQALASFVAQLRHDLYVDGNPRSWAENVGWLTTVAYKYLGGDTHRSAWPTDEVEAAHRVEEALERLAGLDSLGGPPPSIGLFRRTLDSELDAALRRTGRPGDGVLVGHVSVAAGMVFDRVAVLGLSEGRFPPRRLEDSLLPDIERHVAGGHLQLRTHRAVDDRRDLLAAIASASQVLLSHPRGDLRRSTDQPASRWLLSDAARLAHAPTINSVDLPSYSDEPWFNHIASFAGGLARSTRYANDQELRLAAIGRHLPHHTVFADDVRSQAALAVVHARRSAEFTRFDGNLASLAPDIGPPELVSASRLEAWAKCPRSYLFGHVLGVERVEEPERRFDIDPLTRGSIVHAILEEFVRDAIDSKHAFNTWTDADHVRLQEIAATHFDRAEQEGATGRAILWRAERVRLAAELDRLLVNDAQRLAKGYRPVAVEMSFSDTQIELPDGHVLHMRGSIDRVDRGLDGSLAVIDYKTGSAGAYSKLSELDPHHSGQRLQLFVYSQAALAEYPDASGVRADYWFTKDDKQKGYPITDSVRTLVSEAIQKITTGIGAGVFPAHPADQPTWGWVDCWYCTPDGLSSQHVIREWERKQVDPALAGYLALTQSEGIDVD